MTPIISPWFVYCLGMINNLHFALGVALVIGGLFIGGIMIAMGIAAIEGNNEDKQAMMKFKSTVHFTGFLIALIICLMVDIFIPSRSTLIGMYIANKVTVDTLNNAKTSLKDVHLVLKQDVLDFMDVLESENSKTDGKDK
jgi:hypothetical protein